MTTEVIELMPGRGAAPGDYTSRLDWSPIAQPPGKDGVMAHTPDPKAYHRSADGRTILPRATKHGASRAFDSSRPGVLNVDPADPLSGAGGTLVDVEELRREEPMLQKAANLAEGDPAIAWDLVTKGRAERAAEEVRAAPPMPGYVVPSSTTGGQQVTGAGNYAAGVVAPGTTARGAAVQVAPAAPAMVNPAIHHKESPVEPPQIVPVGPPVPAANQAPQPAAAPVASPQPALQAAPQPVPSPQPQTDPAQLAILQALQGLTEAVGALRNGHAAPAQEVTQPTQAAPSPPQGKPDAQPEGPDWQAAADEAVANTPVVKQTAQRDSSSPAAQMGRLFGLPFLHPTPQKPTEKVLFDLGRGGQHLKRFHHVEITKDVIVLIYDDRYEGDRFHPPSTDEGEAIHVVFPDQQNESYRVLVPPAPRLNFAVGCLDFLVLVISDDVASPAPKPMEQRTDEELQTWRDHIPTRWENEDATLGQAIREGRFDAGGAV